MPLLMCSIHVRGLKLQDKNHVGHVGKKLRCSDITETHDHPPEALQVEKWRHTCGHTALLFYVLKPTSRHNKLQSSPSHRALLPYTIYNNTTAFILLVLYYSVFISSVVMLSQPESGISSVPVSDLL